MAHLNRSLDRSLFPVGVNLFVLRDGKLLLGKRKDSSYHDGEWGVPGGHLEGGETMRQCAARELQEETGMSASVFSLVCVDNDIRQDGYHYVHFGFMAEDAAGEPEVKEPDKCYEWRWFGLDTLPAPIFIGHQKLLEALVHKKLFVE